MPLELTPQDRDDLAGDRGEAVALAMRLVTTLAEVSGAERLLSIGSAHVDGCLYHGRAGLDFARRLTDGDARVVVPTTLNVGALDLLHPGLVRMPEALATEARELMDAYVGMGCRPTWTCAPYQLPERPAFGTHVAWAESNAIVFANSVLGARTDRYGDFIDICCAITGRAPEAGLHLDAARRARAVFAVEAPQELLVEPAAHAAIGLLVGRAAGGLIPAIDGLPPDETGEDHLKALGAAAASSGAVGMFHAVGITPEAPTMDAATGGAEPELRATLRIDDLRSARDDLTSIRPGDAIGAVSLGTPHASIREVERLAAMLAGRRLAVPLYVNLGRGDLPAVEGAGWAEEVRAAGGHVVTDTCTYLTPIIRGAEGPVVTDSAKWAWYAPANLGLEVGFATLEECLRSAEQGRFVRDEGIWGG
jgi:predicted aconitase